MIEEAEFAMLRYVIAMVGQGSYWVVTMASDFLENDLPRFELCLGFVVISLDSPADLDFDFLEVKVLLFPPILSHCCELS